MNYVQNVGKNHNSVANMAAIMAAMLDSTTIQYFKLFLYDTIAFPDPKNLYIDTNIMVLRWLLSKI